MKRRDQRIEALGQGDRPGGNFFPQCVQKRIHMFLCQVADWVLCRLVLLPISVATIIILTTKWQ
jgi:hypothetical protein